MDPMVAWTTFGLYKSTVSFEHTISVTPNQSHNLKIVPSCLGREWNLKQQSNQTHRFSSQWNFKTAKQVFGVASALIFFKSNSFIKDFFDVDTAWKSFWVEYKCSNSKFESILYYFYAFGKNNLLMVLYFFLL
jgi:hypothetical protein